MIGPAYPREMARYNAWQNRQIHAALEGASLDDLRQDHGAFFGSILGTLSHILWGDRIWMSRFAPDLVAAPEGGIKGSPELCPTLAVWSAERFVTDAAIARWADKLHALDLTGDLTWHSGALGREVSKPKALCVVHMFNHQTHHRGQLHAMMTRAGFDAPVSDLFAMPGT